MIDILMATYNGEKYIANQLDSIINQDIGNWKLIIHDDQSIDGTMDIVRNIARDFNKIAKNNRSICAEVNKSPYRCAAGNFFSLIRRAESEYVMFSDQDDVWHEDKVQKTLKMMKKLERKYGKSVPLLVYTDLAVVDSDLNKISDSFIEYMQVPPKIYLPRLLIQNSVTGCTMMMNRALYTLLKNVTDVDKIVMHDHFAAMAAVVFGKIAFLPQATIDYRQHGNNSVGAANAKSLQYLWKRFRRGRLQFQSDMKKAMVQAGYFFDLFNHQIGDEKTKKLIFDFSNMQTKNKGQRIFFYMKNHVIKYGAIRAIMQIIWG